MQRILLNLLTFFVAGLLIMTFLYVASIVIPILLLVVIGGVVYLKLKSKKTIRQWAFYEETHKEKTPESDVIDVEYEVVDDKKR